MKIFSVLLIILLSYPVFSKDEKKDNVEKNYSPEEFKKKLNEELVKKIARFSPKNLSNLSKELLKKESDIEIKDNGLAAREKQLQFNEKEFEKKVKSFNTRQKKFIACVDKGHKDIDKRITHMVEVISNMKPDKASKVLSVQDTTIAVKILSKLDAKKASKIFNLMDKEISARLQKLYLNMK